MAEHGISNAPAAATPQSPADTRLILRPYRPADRQAVRDICVKTCWMGEDQPDAIPDGWVWAEFWTRYFTDRETSHTWVIARKSDDIAVGYLTGAADARAADKFTMSLLPAIAWHVFRSGLLMRRTSRKALRWTLAAMIRGEMNIPENVSRQYPATCHIDLLPEARGAGWGRRLLDTFLDRLRQKGIHGMHAQTLSINQPVNHMLERCGLRCLAHRPTRAFRHIHPEPIEILTWVVENNLEDSLPNLPADRQATSHP